MGWRGVRWICGVGAGLCALSPAEAHEVDPRLDAPLLRAGNPRPAPRKAMAKSATLALLSQTDRGGLRSVRAHGIEQGFGSFDLVIEAARLRGGRGSPDEPVTAGDRYSASSLAVNADFDLGGGFLAGPTASLMHMKRHFSLVPSGLRPHATDIASAGFRIARAGGPALSFDYVDTSSRKARPLDCMAEIAGGAPLAGRGLRLGLAGGEPGRLTWGLALSAMRRPRGEFALNDVSGTVGDRRVLFSIGKAF